MIKIGSAFIKEKKPETAIKYYKEAEEILYQNKLQKNEFSNAKIKLGLCEAYFSQKDYKSCEIESKKVNFDASQGWAYYWRAKSCYQLNKMEESKVWTKKSYFL